MGNPTQINNRDWIFQILTAPTTWVEIGELTEFKHDQSQNEETADTGTFRNKGAYSQQVMQRGATLGLTGKWGRTPTSGPVTRDPGQVAVEELAAATGDDSEGTIRFRHESQDEWTEWDCTATLAEQGGGMNEKTGWGVTFTRCFAARVSEVV